MPDLYRQISDGAFQLRETHEQLHRYTQQHACLASCVSLNRHSGTRLYSEWFHK
ncbi:hypothetical protein HALA3H3_910095 [Halomonas sp. A3H3]|nr:hypothetical protein HALA3H3_910095 [Halomonas sp. A3H3]